MGDNRSKRDEGIYIASWNYELFLMDLLQERKHLHNKFFKWLCNSYPHDIIIKDWRGRSEDKWKGKGSHFSQFYCQFDIARAYRTEDRNSSPILIGYEIKGTHKREDSEREIYDPPLLHEGLGQARWMLKQDANFVYVVRPRPRNTIEEKALIELFRETPHHGLIFADQINDKISIKEMVEPSNPNLKINLDRKRGNLTFACTSKVGHGEIQKQEWARKHEFFLS